MADGQRLCRIVVVTLAQVHGVAVENHGSGPGERIDAQRDLCRDDLGRLGGPAGQPGVAEDHHAGSSW